MRIVSNHGCITDGLWINDKNAADMTEKQLTKTVIFLLNHGYGLDTGGLMRVIDDIAEQNGEFVDGGHCEQCGDSFYSFIFDTEDGKDRRTGAKDKDA